MRSTARERGTRAVRLLFDVSPGVLLPSLYGALRSRGDRQAPIEPAATRQKWDASTWAAQQAYAVHLSSAARSCRPAQRLVRRHGRREVLPKPKGLRSGRSRGLKVEIGLGPQRKKYRALIVRTLRLCAHCFTLIRAAQLGDTTQASPHCMCTRNLNIPDWTVLGPVRPEPGRARQCCAGMVALPATPLATWLNNAFGTAFDAIEMPLSDPLPSVPALRPEE